MSSAGTGDWHVGDPADPRTAETLRRLMAKPERVVLLRSFDPTAGGDLDVPDPYFGDAHHYDEVLGMVHAAVPGLLAWVRGRL